jgi:hypothetical protein
MVVVGVVVSWWLRGLAVVATSWHVIGVTLHCRGGGSGGVMVTLWWW